MAKIHVLHESAAWTAPPFEALERRALPYRDWHRAEGLLDLSAPPPAGASSLQLELSKVAQDQADRYDVNTDTNHNPEAEAAAGLSGRAALRTPLGAAAD